MPPPTFALRAASLPAWVTASVVAFAVAGCSGQPLLDLPVTPVAESTVAPSKTMKRESAALVSKAQADLKSTSAVIAAARALRAEGERGRALALLEKASIAQPDNAALIRETGLVSLELGNIGKAELLLAKAVEHDNADWQTRSALGAALASAGKHQQAQKQFAKALELAPDHPAILNNLALSYALDGKPAEAEHVLRIAASAKGSPPQVKQNLALVLSAGGKLAEAQKLTQGTPPSNAAYLKALAERANGGADRKSTQTSSKPLPPPYGLGATRVQ